MAAAGARALDLLIDLGVDNVVIGAAGATHGHGADEEQQQYPD